MVAVIDQGNNHALRFGDPGERIHMDELPVAALQRPAWPASRTSLTMPARVTLDTIAGVYPT